MVLLLLVLLVLLLLLVLWALAKVFAGFGAAESDDRGGRVLLFLLRRVHILFYYLFQMALLLCLLDGLMSL